MEVYCEICGKPVTNTFVIEIGRRYMKVCEDCKVLGKVIQVKTPTKPTLRKIVPQVKKESNKPSIAKEIELEIREDFAQVIKKARENMGLTQDMLASIIGEKLSLVKKIEGGKMKPTIEVAKKLEKTLKINLLEQVNLEEKKLNKTAKSELTLGDIVDIDIE